MKRSPRNKIVNVVLYVRVSTSEQADNALSLPAQLKALRQYCEVRGYNVVAEYVEPGATATDDNRPSFKRMISDVLAPSATVDAVLVVWTSRFMRNVAKSQSYKAMLKKRGVRVIAIQQETNDDPSGHMMEGVFELFDQYESEANGARTSAAMAENARQGYFNGSRPPYGFKIERVEFNPGSYRNKLVPDAREAELLREVLRVYIRGAGAKTTARDLNARGLLYRDNKLWSTDLVLKVVSEEAAIGRYHWGKRDSRTGHRRAPDEWVSIDVEPIVDRELFEVAQRIRAERDPERKPGRVSSSPLLLAGLLHCGRCGAACSLETSGKQNADGEYMYRYYNCREFLRKGKEACVGNRVPVEQIDTAVRNHLGRELFSEERCRQLLHDFVEESGIMRQKTHEQRRMLERELEDVERRMQKWEQAFESGANAVDIIVPKLRELKERRDELKAVLAKVIPLRKPPPYLYNETVVKKFQASLQELFTDADQRLAKNYLRMLVDNITITGDVVEIEGRTYAAVALMAAGASPTGLNHQEQVLTTVQSWRPRAESNCRPTV